MFIESNIPKAHSCIVPHFSTYAVFNYKFKKYQL